MGPGEHGTTFGGAPLACAAVDATLSIIRKEGLLFRAKKLGKKMKESLIMPGVVGLRGDGVWLGVELDRPAKPVSRKLLALGFIVGTASDPNVLRLSPPAVTPIEAVNLLVEALNKVLTAPPDEG